MKAYCELQRVYDTSFFVRFPDEQVSIEYLYHASIVSQFGFLWVYY